MKRPLLCLGLAVLAATLPAATPPEPTYVYPQTAFDEASTRRQLEPGTITLRGNAATKANKVGSSFIKHFTTLYPARPGTVVTLYPYTPYFEEWYKLRKSLAKGGKLAVMSPLAYSYRIVTKVTDAKGNFEFTQLQPGRYYLEAVIAFTQEMYQRVHTATETTYNMAGQQLSSNPIYTRYYYDYHDRGFAEAIVDLRAGAGVVEVNLR